MIRPKDAEAYCQAVDAEEKARIAAGERRATHKDIEEYINAIRYEWDDYWGICRRLVFSFIKTL